MQVSQGRRTKLDSILHEQHKRQVNQWKLLCKLHTFFAYITLQLD